MTSIMLVIPPHGYKRGIMPLTLGDCPMGPPYLVRPLQAEGHTVYGLNVNNIRGYDSPSEMLAGELRCALYHYQPDVVGLGGLCTDYAAIRDSIAIVRKFAPNTKIVVGGGIINNDRVYAPQILGADQYVIGDGEIGLPHALNEQAGMIDGGTQTSLDSFAFPNLDLFGVHGMLEASPYVRYIYRYTRPKPRVMSLVASRGCVFQCTFCTDHRRSYRARSILNLMAEIKEKVEKYEPNIFILLDELFAITPDRVRDFSEGIIEGQEKWGWDFDWAFQTHASARLDEETLKLAKRAGCYMVVYGLESASPDVLDSIGKHSKPEQIVELVEKTDRLKIAYSGNIIVGDPAEKTQTVRESIRFWNKHLRDTHVFFGAIRPYPGAKVFADYFGDQTLGQRQSYYEHIDERLFNMTKLPDFIWLPWANLAAWLGDKFPWVKVAKLGKCPHCGATVADNAAPCVSKMLKTPFHVLRHRVRLALCLVLSFWHPLYRELMPLWGDAFGATITGCLSCGKRVAIHCEKAK